MPGPSGVLNALARGPGAGLTWLAHRRRVGRRAWLGLTVEPSSAASNAATLRALRGVVHDPLVGGVLLCVRGAPGGWAMVEDWRAAIDAVRAAGRRVEAYAEVATEGCLAVAAAADRVTLHPDATVLLSGVGAEVSHQGAALARLGLEAEVVAAGAFKSAGEPWSRRFASPAAREALAGLLGDLSALARDALASSRGIDPARVDAAREAGLLSAEEAVARGLVDAVGTWADTASAMRDRLGPHASEVPFGAWAVGASRLDALDHAGDRPRIAVVHLAGAIVLDDRGIQGDRLDARPTVEALSALADDDDVVAVVVHVDSPGGGVLPSRMIGDAVARLALRKPVVAAYADVSASGGVMLSAAATRVVARHGTITGSIGVVGGKLVARGALRRVGVAVEPVGGSPSAGMFSASRPFTEGERARFEATLARTYDDFVARVAVGRGRSVADIEPACRGRVWTGRQARAHGLVDVLGTLHDAEQLAANLAGLDADAAPVFDDLNPAERTPWERARAFFAMEPGPLDASVWLDEAAAAAWGPLGPLLRREPGVALAVWPWGDVRTLR